MTLTRVKLARHAFRDRPDWVLIKEEVPLGTEYDIIMESHTRDTIVNSDTKERREVDIVYGFGNGSFGWMIADVFDLD